MLKIVSQGSSSQNKKIARELYKKSSANYKKITNLTLLLKEKEQEVRIAKQKTGFFARKYAEALERLENRSRG